MAKYGQMPQSNTPIITVRRCNVPAFLALYCLIDAFDFDTENYPKIHTAAPDTEIMFSIVSSEGLYSSKNRSTLYFDNRALMPCRI